jgi:hypothetical protein
LRCTYNDVPGSRSFRRALEVSLDAAFGGLPVRSYAVAAKPAQFSWEVTVSCDERPPLTMQVAPDDQPLDERDVRRLAVLGMNVRRAVVEALKSEQA